MVRIAVNGAAGRMGSRILALAAASPKEFEIAGAFEHEKSDKLGQSIDLGERKILVERLSADSLKGKGVLIDFSGPTGTPTAFLRAEKAGWGLVIGTTGLDRQTDEMLRLTKKKIPMVISANMSVGVNLVAEALELLASRIGGDFKISMTEAHHVHKKDAPSGTALMLKNAMASAKQEIDIKSIREGEIVGDHTVLFTGAAETIEVTHRARSRDVFALGALRAAAFLAAKGKPGKLYSMRDVLRG